MSKEDRVKIQENRKQIIVGTPEKVKNELLQLSERYQTEEFMIIANAYNFQDKIQFYTLLAEALL
ncbi:hypothetical protein JMM81_14120 [Bacillus sp. V3B]|uniref:hypothetical protein n=1 Tax=Bacillus sp. V3B TaxID=2804915 RepID=UPI00210EFE93|nr:hypothetical protein [Bacillus sp. V3B]MCQ6276068.1 hypothetical protein [Bacillus sp. V3B]